MSTSTPSVYRAHKTRSKARAAPVDHPESTVEEPHSAEIAPAPEHEIATAPRGTPPSAAASSGDGTKRFRQIEPRKYSAVEARRLLDTLTKRGRSNTSTS